jgi:acyl carrier protein
MIYDKVVAILCDSLARADKITPSTDIISDLGADSLDVVTLMMCFEDEFGVAVSDEDAQDLRTVSDIVSYIEARV